MKKLYISYGVTLSKKWMKHHCPTANPIAVATLNDHQLVFQGNTKANVIPAKGKEVPVVVWEITDQDERQLDAYEPSGYNRSKEQMVIEVDGKMVDAIIYVLPPEPFAAPADRYLQFIAEGYGDFNLPVAALNEAVYLAYESSVMNGAKIYTHENTVPGPAQ